MKPIRPRIEEPTTAHEAPATASEAPAAVHEGPTAAYEGLKVALQGLAAMHRELAGADTLVCGPRGHLVAPRDAVAGADHVLIGGRRVARTRTTETVIALTGLAGVAAVRVTGPTFTDEPSPATAADEPGPATAADEPGPATAGGEPDPATAAVLGRLRLTWSRRLLETALAYLGERRSGGAPLLERQLVRATLAEAVIGHHEVDALLSGTGDVGGHQLRALHRRITTVDRALLGLFGAHGFTLAGPATGAHLSEVLADAYLGA